MANWCLNSVVFSGESHRMEELRVLIEEIIKREEQEHKGQLFHMVSAGGGYLFETTYDDGVLAYLTKWSPNTYVLVALAEHLDLGFTHQYEECGMMIYGQDFYKNGELVQIMLDDDDFALYQFDEQSGCYEFEGMYFRDDTEILETLLRRKIAVYHLLNPTEP